MMKFQFSIVIPTLNGARTLPALLDRLAKITSNYTSELIVIDSGSTDGTDEIVARYRGMPTRFIRIDRKDFNHGRTRNRGAGMARGEYVCYFSQDVLPKNNRMFGCYLEDFRLHPDVVAVFAENIPRRDASFLQKIENECRWDRLNRFTDKSGVLLQTREKPFVPYTPEHYFLWYFFGDTASCFKRSFLMEHPFPPAAYGEDIMMGKTIIEAGLAKVYDTRSPIYHSHEYDLGGFYARQKDSLRLRYNLLGLKERGQLPCKIKKIIRADLRLWHKLSLLVKLFWMYLLKAGIFLQLKYEQHQT